MRTATAVVRGWKLDRVEGDPGPFHAASLVKQVVGHLALTVLSDLDEPLWNGITSRHALSHTIGLPNWRPAGEETQADPTSRPTVGLLRGGFVLLQGAIERQAGRPITELAQELVFTPLGMSDSRLGEPEVGLHGSRPLFTTASDYGLFLSYVLGETLLLEGRHVMDRDLLNLYERASAWTASMVPSATKRIDASTPCDGWDVKTLMNHMLDTQRYFVGAARGTN
jgi:CubicO group peptidase (beta-lactamase class C family)